MATDQIKYTYKLLATQMPRKTASKKRAASEREAKLMLKSTIPGALTVETSAIVETLRTTGPVYFYGSIFDHSEFLSPEYEGQGKISASKRLRDEHLHSNGVEKKHAPPGCRTDPFFRSQEHLLYTFMAWLDNSIYDGGYLAAKNRDHLLKRVWEKEEYNKETDELFHEDEEDQCVTKHASDSSMKKWNKNPNHSEYTQKWIWVRSWPDHNEVDEIKLVVDMSVRCKFLHSRKTWPTLQKLLATKGRELIYAHPYDRYLGVGFDPLTAGQEKNNWGENVLGLALMSFRDNLTEEEIQTVRREYEEELERGITGEIKW